MNAHTAIASLALLAAALAPSTSIAGEASAGVAIVIDCARPALPSQREVGQMLEQSNFSQVYASRARLMAEARRACQRARVAHVRVVREAPPSREPALARARVTR